MIIINSFLKASRAMCMIPVLFVVYTGALAADTTLRNTSPFPFGASLNVTLLRNNATYRAVVTREYNSVTAENVMKMGPIHPGINTYDWINADTLVNFAQQNNQRVHGHTLIWHQSLPAWVNAFTGDSAAWENIFKSHIQTVVGHYAGRLASWDVVNEAFNDNGSLRNSTWLQRLGPGYISRAFQYAHLADPNALLFYNDYGQEYSTAKLNAIDSLLKKFLAQGVPVHGVGLQLHINKNTANTSLANAVRVMAQTGLRVHLSELDIALNPEGNQNLTFTPALSQMQADKYNFITRLYKSLPAYQQYGITTWNVSDKDSWITGTYMRPDWPLPFDTLYQKKQAYHAIIEGMNSKWNYDAAGAQSASGTYADIGLNGTVISTSFTGGAMTFDNDNSSPQPIGFPFSFNGTTYTQFVLNTNGFIKLGVNPPSSASIFYPTYNGNTNGVITAPDTDMLYPYNHDLIGTPGTEYRVYTSGLPGARVCTVQYKAVADKLAPVQYADMNFQVKLHEGSNMIEYCYGSWIASTSAPTLITGALGIKGSYANNSVNLAKGSATSWAGPLGTASGIYFINGDYSSAGPQFNTRNTALPDVGRTYRFLPLSQYILPLTVAGFSALNRKNDVIIKWVTSKEVNCKNFEVQRASGTAEFKTIITIATAGNGSPLTTAYDYLDATAAGLHGTVYYRLKLNDNDGRFQYSDIVSVNRGRSDALLIQSNENPFKRHLDLKVTCWEKSKVLLYVININGTVLIKKEAALEAGINHVLLKETGTLPKGFYLVRCVKGNETRVLKVIKE